MSGLLTSYLSYDSLCMIFKGFFHLVQQLQIAVTFLLLGVERAVKTYAELLVPFRGSATFGLPILPVSIDKLTTMSTNKRNHAYFPQKYFLLERLFFKKTLLPGILNSLENNSSQPSSFLLREPLLKMSLLNFPLENHPSF